MIRMIDNASILFDMIYIYIYIYIYMIAIFDQHDIYLYDIYLIYLYDIYLIAIFDQQLYSRRSRISHNRAIFFFGQDL